jgi:hypothetical protein
MEENERRELTEEMETSEEAFAKEPSGKTVSADITIGTKDMFYFFMRHNYACFSGLFGLFISLGALILLIVRFKQYETTAKCLLLLVALLFTVIQPLQLLLKAANQIKRSPMFSEPIHYTFRQDGLEISQKDQSGVIPWEQVMKAVDTGKYIIIYITRMRAYIFPKEQMEHLDEIKEIIRSGCQA